MTAGAVTRVPDPRGEDARGRERRGLVLSPLSCFRNLGQKRPAKPAPSLPPADSSTLFSVSPVSPGSEGLLSAYILLGCFKSTARR